VESRGWCADFNPGSVCRKAEVETGCRCVTGKFPSLPPPLGRHRPIECACSNIPQRRRMDLIGWAPGRVARPAAAAAPTAGVPAADLARRGAESRGRRHEVAGGNLPFRCRKPVVGGGRHDAPPARRGSGEQEGRAHPGKAWGRIWAIHGKKMAGPTGLEPAAYGLRGPGRSPNPPSRVKKRRKVLACPSAALGACRALSAPAPAQNPYSSIGTRDLARDRRTRRSDTHAGAARAAAGTEPQRVTGSPDPPGRGRTAGT